MELVPRYKYLDSISTISCDYPNPKLPCELQSSKAKALPPPPPVDKVPTPLCSVVMTDGEAHKLAAAVKHRY